MYFLSSRSTTLFSLEKICLNYFHKLESKVSSYRNGSDEVANLKKNVKIRKCVKESIRESNEVTFKSRRRLYASSPFPPRTPKE